MVKTSLLHSEDPRFDCVSDFESSVLGFVKSNETGNRKLETGNRIPAWAHIFPWFPVVGLWFCRLKNLEKERELTADCVFYSNHNKP